LGEFAVFFPLPLAPFPVFALSAFALFRVSPYNPSLARSAVAPTSGFAPTFYFGRERIFEHQGAG
jgi:hypothetical protein